MKAEQLGKTKAAKKAVQSVRRTAVPTAAWLGGYSVEKSARMMAGKREGKSAVRKAVNSAVMWVGQTEQQMDG